MIGISVKIDDQATPFLAAVREHVGKPRGLHTRIAGRVETLVRDYIRTTGDRRHKTARALGATPTLHYIRAAHTVKGKAVPTGAEISLRGEIFARVDRDVTVTAKAAKFLTIPAHKLSYGKRARELGGLRFVKFKGGKMALVREVKGHKPDVMYWLKKSVLLRRDRSLLPEDREFAEAMEAGAEDFLLARFEAKQAGRNPDMI